MDYGVFEGNRIDNGKRVTDMLIEYGGDAYILTMLGSSHKNNIEFDERFWNKILETCGYRVDYDSVKQIKTLTEYLNGHSDFESRYLEVID